ncbi:hypothetical protein [Acidisoma sp.]|uniref:hypothetical protein n=1 Tax=Acidisoma sp. TaxID=1872115 RepID=UPI003AFFC5E9
MAGPLLLLPLLAACSSAGGIAGAAVGAATGAATANPLVGYAVAIGVQAGTQGAVNYYMRVRQHAEQTAIATVAGPLPPGVVMPWKIEHDIPIGDEHGEVQVARVIDTPLAFCEEIVFTVAKHKAPQPADPHYVATTCRENGGWRWASAEPAVARWGFLQ